MEVGQAVFAVIALAGTGVIGYGGIRAINVLVKHYAPRNSEAQAELEAELRDIRGRLDESEHAQQRIAELEERLDFAERLLAQQREQAKLPAGERES